MSLRRSSSTNFFPDHEVLWAGIGNNPSADSSYWQESHAIRIAVIAARRQLTWSAYVKKFANVLDLFNIK